MALTFATHAAAPGHLAKTWEVGIVRSGEQVGMSQLGLRLHAKRPN